MKKIGNSITSRKSLKKILILRLRWPINPLLWSKKAMFAAFIAKSRWKETLKRRKILRSRKLPIPLLIIIVVVVINLVSQAKPRASLPKRTSIYAKVRNQTKLLALVLRLLGLILLWSRLIKSKIIKMWARFNTLLVINKVLMQTNVLTRC